MISLDYDQPELDQLLSTSDITGRLKLIADIAPNSVFTTSLGVEDQLLTHFIATNKIQIRIITLQTGRLFAQTIDLIEKTRKKYNIDIVEDHPDKQDIDTYIEQYGLNGFYDSVEARHACCNIRKLVPLARALEHADGWITGLRREQSNNRKDVPFCEYPSQNDEGAPIKFNPLADLSRTDLLKMVEDFEIPVNPLHNKGYPSIGCEPCTRALKPGEDERAGRWWWEQENARECGLHTSNN